jgi:tetratricopeptide (TPR) repeat protein
VSDNQQPEMFRYPLTGTPVDGYLEELLVDGNGKPLSVAEAVKRYGNLRVRRAALASAHRKRSLKPKIRGYPPRVFFSYRWENEAQKVWVRRLARYLRERGFRVNLDLEHQDKLGEEGVGIAEYVASIIDSNIFLAVITQKYLEGELREWILEEGQNARLFSHAGLRVVSLWKEGTELPDWGRGHVVDIRHDVEDFSALDEFFDYDGPVLSERQEEELVNLLAAVEALLRQEQFAETLEELAKHPQLAEAVEYQQSMAAAYFGLGKLDEAAQLAMDILAGGILTVETTVYLCLLLSDLGIQGASLFYMSGLNQRSDAMGWRYAHLKADLLDEMGNYRAALNHLRFAMMESMLSPEIGPEVLNDFGYILLFRLGRPTEALPYFQKAAKQNALSEAHITNLVICLSASGDNQRAEREWQQAVTRFGYLPKLMEIKQALDTGYFAEAFSELADESIDSQTHICSHCEASYDLSDATTVICARCGADYQLDSETGTSCPYCSNNTIVPAGHFRPDNVNESRCPVCAQGELSAS